MDKLTILGLSEPVLTMIFTNLESQQLFPKVVVVNNLDLEPIHPYAFPNFELCLRPILEDRSSLFFLGVNKAKNKRKVVDFFKPAREKMLNLFHQTAAIASTASFGKGCMANSQVSIAGFAKIGDFVTINRNASIGHHTTLADFVTVNPGVNISGFVKIGSGTTIGLGANVIDGIEIGENVVIGSGALVTKNIPDNVVAYGNPCKVIRKNE